MKNYLDPHEGLLRGVYADDKDTLVVGSTVGDLRKLDKGIRTARQREAKLLAFVLAASAENPAHIGSYANKAIELLTHLGIQPRETGTFYTDRRVELRVAEALLP